jgi:beta-phosphoglucomutase
VKSLGFVLEKHSCESMNVTIEGVNDNLIKAVVFDMDGVLIDAQNWHYEALNIALKPFNMEISLELHISRMDGLPTKEKLKYLSENYGLPSALHGIIFQLKQDLTKRMAQQFCYPNQDHLLMMGFLKNKNLKIGLVTNSIRETTLMMLELAKLKDSFDEILTNEDVQKNKPFPDSYIEMAKRLNVLPKEILVIEDSPYGVKAAEAAGCKVIRVNNTREVNWHLIKEYLQ